jgi:hypothetical protein
MNLLVSDEAEIAAQWWADLLLRTPQHRIAADRPGERDDGLADLFEVQLMFAGAEHSTLSAAQIETFADCLADLIRTRLMVGEAWEIAARDGSKYGSYHRAISVDYDPPQIIKDAWIAAGGGNIAGVFPSKTTMWVNPCSVRLKFGYGGEIQEIMPQHK